MQLSFSSFPSDPTSTVAAAAPAQVADGITANTANCPASAIDGFAQLLSVISPGAPGTTVPTSPFSSPSVMADTPVSGGVPDANVAMLSAIAPQLPTGATPMTGSAALPLLSLNGRGLNPQWFGRAPVVAGSDPQNGSVEDGPEVPLAEAPTDDPKPPTKVDDQSVILGVTLQLPTTLPTPISTVAVAANNVTDEAAATSINPKCGPTLPATSGKLPLTQRGITPAPATVVAGNAAVRPDATQTQTSPASVGVEAPDAKSPLDQRSDLQLKTDGSDASVPMIENTTSDASDSQPDAYGWLNRKSGGEERAATMLAPDRASTSESAGQSAGALPMEKIAAIASQFADSGRLSEKQFAKSLVAAAPKQVTQSNRAFGIGSAEPTATMPAGSTSAFPNSSETVAVQSTAAAAENQAHPDVLPQPVALTSSAHRAVEAVLSATDRFASRDQHSVNLQFTVGGSDLNVRVELRAGEVHTTFRTDSAELRAALAGEWGTMTAQNHGDRATKMAPPVFASSEHNSNGMSGENASRHREPDARQTPQGFDRAFLSRLTSGSSTTTQSTAAAPVTRSVAANSVHLHTLA